MLAFKLAYRNLIGAGLRTWLNVIVLSFSFVYIIWGKGLLMGWDRQAKTDMKNWEIGDGQYWHEAYDPFDQFTLNDAHAPVPGELAPEIEKGNMVPTLIAQGSIFPNGRMMSILIKGIDPRQKILELPTYKLDTAIDEIPAIIGGNMARNSKLKTGDFVTLRWRDANGTFDAAEIVITEVFVSNVPTVDAFQVWIPLEKLQSMMQLPGEATVITFKGEENRLTRVDGWKYKSFQSLVSDIDEMIKTKSVGQYIFYVILLLLAMLAIFDTQVLSIFRRQKEIGTYIALGYTRGQVVGLFTVEGAMHAVLAAGVAAVYGVPLLLWQSKAGIPLPADYSGDWGITIADTMYPAYSAGLIITTTLIVCLTTTFVSYLPSRKIARMNPTEALRGKLQ
jgi:ABC-type lipoprotein release transport system permease subunit